MTKKLPFKEVPCNGCTLCCQGDAIRLEEEDRAEEFRTELHPYVPGALMLAHKPNGDCVYLDEHGCSIHGRAPSLCRTADCRAVALKLDFETARHLHALGRLDFRVWNKGREFLEEMQREARSKRRER